MRFQATQDVQRFTSDLFVNHTCDSDKYEFGFHISTHTNTSDTHCSVSLTKQQATELIEFLQSHIDK